MNVLREIVFGAKPLDEGERQEILLYYQKSLQSIAAQDSSAAGYNRVLSIHLNNLDSHESVEIVRVAAEELEQSAKQLLGSHAQISPIPGPALEDHAAWHLALMDYQLWAESTHTIFKSLSRMVEQQSFAGGLAPFAPKIQEPAQKMEASKQEAEKAGRKLLKKLGLRPTEYQALLKTAQQAIDEEDSAGFS